MHGILNIFLDSTADLEPHTIVYIPRAQDEGGLRTRYELSFPRRLSHLATVTLEMNRSE
jgi:hypothetical protein